MKNETLSNIVNKRKAFRKRRRIKIFRLIFIVVLLSLLASAFLFIGLSVFNIAQRVYTDFDSMYQSYHERRLPRDPKFDGFTNILILGIDDAAQGDNQADTILVLSFDHSSGKSRIISIPRNTWVSADSSYGHLSNLYSWGGANLLVRHISSLLGVSIHQYIIIGMSTFAELIDIIGGVDIYVEQDMDYIDTFDNTVIHLQRGFQHLDGSLSQQYLRYYSDTLGDIGRVQRQQKFLKSLYSTILQLDTIPKLPAIAEIFRTQIITSAEIFDSAHLANVLRSMSSDPPLTFMLPGSENSNGSWIPNIAEIDARMAELFPVQDIQDFSDEDFNNS